MASILSIQIQMTRHLIVFNINIRFLLSDRNGFGYFQICGIRIMMQYGELVLENVVAGYRSVVIVIVVFENAAGAVSVLRCSFLQRVRRMTYIGSLTAVLLALELVYNIRSLQIRTFRSGGEH